ncbi:nucleoprotein [Fusarium asiaticum negative-stranded RNA virus 1]|uniref:Nucleoprotein n=1 Tax=Fusarium asiaticum negative-stranded RNA virus 1 TaxID=2921215 RepID=A0AA46MEL7_9MONO|nr:nucleoprotein [Fusarium asiaticum negative-stranded RNA virus 1]UNG44330.1 nucleoprotein [Fusarium asiaticum negative-stranded RNA virus 1]
MVRPIPGVFLNKDTYGVNSDQERDRLPVLDQHVRCSLTDILVGEKGIPIMMCLAALSEAEDADDIAKLVIGAMVSASGVSPDAAKISKHPGDIVSSVINWARIKFSSSVVEEDTAEDNDVPEGSKTAEKKSVSANPFPFEDFPAWFRDLEIGERALLDANRVNEFELYAYAGVLAYAIAKQPDAANLEAFNAKRRNAVAASMVNQDMQIFVDNSPHLTLEILGKVHRVFSMLVSDRACVLSAIVDNDVNMIQGPKRMFYTIFRLSSGASLNTLLIITKFARRFPQLYQEFPDLETEYHATSRALTRFYDAAEHRRLYMKVIFGSAYVPIDRNDVANLLGVAVFALQQSDRTLANYRGGQLTVAHREKLLRLLNISADKSEEVETIESN